MKMYSPIALVLLFFSWSNLAAEESGLRAQYWSDQDQTFLGMPTLTRIDPQINVDWQSSSPDPSISNDHFTARWMGQITAPASEVYTFTATTDDGVRLWVDGRLLIDHWQDQSPTPVAGAITLVAGQAYDLRMDYYEHRGGAVARLAWSSPSMPMEIVPASRLSPAPTNAAPTVATAASAVPNPVVSTLSTLHVLGADADGGEAALTYTWASVGTPPAPVAFSSNGTNAAKETVVTLAAAGTYIFQVTISDAGWLSAVSEVVVTTTGTTFGTGLQAAYWTDKDGTFNGSPTLTRVDPQLNFAWAYGSPDPSISSDHFTARWTGQIEAPVSETYTFTSTTDDGVRLWIDGQLLIDQWIDESPTAWSGAIALTAGRHYDLCMEYYEHRGGAAAQLAWSSPSIPMAIIPTGRLFVASTSVSFATVTTFAQEYERSVAIALIMTPAPSSATDVTVQVAGTASADDYTIPTATVHFAAGQAQASLVVDIHGDEQVENDETVELTLVASSQITVGGNPHHSITIHDPLRFSTTPQPQSATINTQVVGFRSEAVSDLQGEPPVHYAWTILSGADGATWVDPSLANAEMIVAVPGSYQVRCVASVTGIDDSGTERTFTAGANADVMVIKSLVFVQYPVARVDGDLVSLSIQIEGSWPSTPPIYTWRLVSGPAAVTFEDTNGTSAAALITARVTQSGDYIFTCDIIWDGQVYPSRTALARVLLVPSAPSVLDRGIWNAGAPGFPAITYQSAAFIRQLGASTLRVQAVPNATVTFIAMEGALIDGGVRKVVVADSQGIAAANAQVVSDRAKIVAYTPDCSGTAVFTTVINEVSP